MNFEFLFFLFLLLALLLGATAGSASRRCVLVDDCRGHRINLSPECESCYAQLPSAEDAPRVMIAISSDTPTTSPLLTVASQLITARLRVVVVRVFDPAHNEDTEFELKKKIISYIPCDVEPLLSFQWVPVEGIHGNLPLDSPFDALSKAEAEYHALVEMDDLPSVMVVRCFFIYLASTCDVVLSIKRPFLAVAVLPELHLFLIRPISRGDMLFFPPKILFLSTVCAGCCRIPMQIVATAFFGLMPCQEGMVVK